MGIPDTQISQFRVGEWWIYPLLSELSGPAGRVQVEARSMDVLVYLAAHPGKVRTKEQIVGAVWGEAFVGDDVLTHAVWDLRRAFGDDARDPRFIQTVHTKGYRLLAEVEMVDLDATLPLPEAEQVLHYRLLEKLGGGGMGVVYKAEDTRLGRTVALKFLAPDKTRDEEAKKRFLREARAASALDHPNICTIHEIAESEQGQLFLVMACYEGATLAERIAEGPLDQDEATVIALQLAEGLAKAHGAGIVHRDIKPANVVVTGDGVVKLLDFGLAKLAGQTKLTGLRTTLGTVAYMAPEQVRGEEVDARADVWSLGALLYELLSGETPFHGGNAQAVIYGILNEEPEALRQRRPEVPEGLARIVERSLEKEPEERYADAGEVLEDLRRVAVGRVVRLRPGRPERSPYPGLAAFTEEDAEFFFGREAEVERLWGKLAGQRLAGLIGPSGAGKSSFVRAGVVPAAPKGWGCLVATPGAEPFIALGQALAPELAGEPEALRELLRIGRPEVAYELVCRWRRRHDAALLVVDQFEELFTLNPDEVQTEFAALLGRLAAEGNVHVLLSMRDDFLIRCHRHESLAGVFADLTPMEAPEAPALRRALVEPASAMGYAFEDEALVEEMLAEVEGERGALPLLAFTAARLWERREPAERRLPRAAYEEIGGVAGALGRYAERVIEKIGAERRSVVRELFRNLTTSQGTRAVRDREELLSVFGGEEREEAHEVLAILVDARLLTSYEVPPAEGGGDGHHRIQIVHESLLGVWPRLVRWQTQDADAAQLRDELRQAARTWQEHGRSDDLLWTGSACRELVDWRHRYPGGLSELEASFADAMVTHAERWKRRRRTALAAAFTLLLLLLGIVGVSRQQAVAEARRAEASKLLALAQLLREEDPTEALAHTTASLELADSEQARLLARELLWEAPPALEVDPGGTVHTGMFFSPDGGRLALAGSSGEIRVFSAAGGSPVVLPQPTGGFSRASWASNELLVTTLNAESYLYSAEGRFRVWSFPGERLVREIDAGGRVGWSARGGRLSVWVEETDPGSGHEILRLRRWSLPDGEAEELGWVDKTALSATGGGFDRGGRGWIYFKDNEIFYRPLPMRDGAADRFLGRHDNTVQLFWQSREEPRRFWTRDVASELRLWDPSSPEPEPLQVVTRPDWLEQGVKPWPEWRWAGSNLWQTQWPQVRLWDLEGWPEARPLRLRRSGSWSGAQDHFDPSRRWTVAITHNTSRLTFWPLSHTWPRIVDGYAAYARLLCFSSDGRWLATGWTMETDVLRLWPLPGNDAREVRSLALPAKQVLMGCSFDPRGRFLFTVGAGPAHIVPLDGSAPRRLEGPASDSLFFAAAVSPSGRRVATAFGCHTGSKTLWMWDLETGERHAFDLPKSSASTTTGCEGVIAGLAFVDESTLYTAGDGGVRRWDLESGAHELVLGTGPDSRAYVSIATGEPTALVQARPIGGGALGTPTIVNLVTGATQALPAFAGGLRDRPASLAIDTSGGVAAVGDSEGIIRVGRVSADEPHLLVGHQGAIAEVAISPDGRWIASTGEDSTLRLWPMPDLDQPPLHTLPRDELLAKLASLTNIRVVRDPGSADGWAVTLDPFPGWREVPTW